MKLKNILTNVMIAAMSMASFSACADWLEVDMEDGIMEESLYKENKGFLVALNGVYSNLNSVYSSFFSMGVLDVMAQYYNIQKNSEHPYYVYANYNYEDKSFETSSGNAWTYLYSYIANVNVLLEHCDEQGSALTERYYGMVKGEALALRAMMHFDMLRFYGPIYSASTEGQPTIPYLETANNKQMLPLLSAKEVAGKVIKDLETASQLLENDSVRTWGVNSSQSTQPNGNNDFRYRQYRLNYYAVQGLLARVHLWTGNKGEAYRIATNIIKEVEEKKTFPWVEAEKVNSAAYPDRVFSSEVMFALYNTNRKNLFDGIFSEELEGKAFSFVGGISGADSKVAGFYGEGSDMDYRKKMWAGVAHEGSEGGETQQSASSYFNKYQDFTPPSSSSEDYSYRYMIPLMRMSEIYLIAAECATTLSEATDYINRIRLHRNVANVSPTEENLKDYITNEFAREVIGEGQLFFFYKRNALESFASGTTVKEPFSMELSDYVAPLPKVETNKRQ